MNKQFIANLWHALFVGIICAVVVGVYAALPIETPLYWAAFIVIPVIFLYGGQWRDIPYHWFNVVVGFFLGGALAFAITGPLTTLAGFPVALALATCVGTFLVQAFTYGVLVPGGPLPTLGRCPMAFVGMISCFAAGGQNYAVAIGSLLVGIVFATLCAQSGKLAARIAGYNPESDDQAA